MYFNDDEIRRIKDAATGHLLDVAQDFHELKRSGVNYNCDCPRCKAAKKLSISPAKQIFKCFGCNELKGGDSVSFLMSAEGMTFNDALEYLAKKFNVILDQRPAIKKQPAKKMKKSSKAAKGIDVDSYCARMLAESGLTFEDVTAKVYKTGDTQSIFEQRTFRPGTIDERGMLTTKGDDVIIEYYDLEGMPVVFTRKDNKRRDVGTPQEYYRIRWQFPDAHLDKEGKPYKYKSPRGSGTPIYIPERIRSLYKSKYLTPDRTKPITARKLGDDFDRAAVLTLLEQNAHRAAEKTAPIPQYHTAETNRTERGKTQKIAPTGNIQRMVDRAAKRAEGKGIGYDRWAAVHNLKQMAATVAAMEQYGFTPDELDAALVSANADLYLLLSGYQLLCGREILRST